jgi:hypothetical protein
MDIALLIDWTFIKNHETLYDWTYGIILNYEHIMKDVIKDIRNDVSLEEYFDALNFDTLYQSELLQLDDILGHKTMLPNWIDCISSNPNINIDMITFDPNNWNLDLVIINNAISISQIEDTPELNWNLIYLRKRSDFTLTQLKKYNHISIDMRAVSNSPNISIHEIIGEPNIKWDWISVSSRDDVTWKIVSDNINMPWKMSYVKFRHYKDAS